MDKENLVPIHSGDVLTKEQTEAVYEFAKIFANIDEETLDKFNSIGCTSFTIITTQEKPIKVIFENEPEVKVIDCDHIEIKEKLSGIKAEKIISNIFGTTDIAIYDCGNMSNEEIESVNPLNGYYNPPFELDEKSR